MNICSNPEEQEHFSLTKCCNVVDRIREAGSCYHQEIDKFGCNERTSHNNGGHAPTSPTPADCTTTPARELLTPPTQDLSSKISETNAPHSRNAHLLESNALFWDKNLMDHALAFVVAPKELKKYAKGKRGTRKCQSRCYRAPKFLVDPLEGLGIW